MSVVSFDRLRKDRDISRREKGDVVKRIFAYKALYAMLLPCIAFFIIFSYIPMGGLILAFKDYKFNMGILGSPWAGFKYFETFFTNYQALELIRNTVVVGMIKVVLEFPFPIILAVMLNELKNERFKRFTQTVSYLPNFLSWVILVTMMQRILAPNTGLLNQLIGLLGGDSSTFYMMEESAFYPIIFTSDLWKNIGWNSIIFLAAITGIDPTLYEAARIDGARKWREIWHITLPSIRPTIGILFIIGLGSLLSSGFDQIYLLRTPGNMSLADTLDVYIIRIGLTGGQYGYATAVGLIQGVVSLILVLAANKASSKLTEVSIW